MGVCVRARICIPLFSSCIGEETEDQRAKGSWLDYSTNQDKEFDSFLVHRLGGNHWAMLPSASLILLGSQPVCLSAHFSEGSA